MHTPYVLLLVRFHTIIMRAVWLYKRHDRHFTIPDPIDLLSLARRILYRYQQHTRTYHGPMHPCAMFAVCNTLEKRGTLSLQPQQRSALYWMILFHDAVMEVGHVPGWNEQQSARYAREVLSNMHYPDPFIDTVERGILATVDHSLADVPDAEKETVGLLLDLDLMGLGQTPAEFARDTESIWLEYKEYITRAEYDAGRKRWARQFLMRKRIYHTPLFAHLEAQARANLSALANS